MRRFSWLSTAVMAACFAACSVPSAGPANPAALPSSADMPSSRGATVPPSAAPSTGTRVPQPTSAPTDPLSTAPAVSPSPRATPAQTAAPLNPPATASPVPFNDFTTYGYDDQRDGYNPNSTGITPASLANLHLAWQTLLGQYGEYNTQGEPVLVTGVAGHAGVLYAGGGSGHTYAYDALTGVKLWEDVLGQESYTCEGGYTFYFGMAGSAAYAERTHSLYIAGNSNTALDAQGSNTLFQLDPATGSVINSVNFAPDPVGPSELDFSHTSVNIMNDTAYVGTGATCDRNSWRGRVAAIDLSSMTLASTFFTTWGGAAAPYGGGGVWGWGGVAVDRSGNVVAGVGNAADGSTGHGPFTAPFAMAPNEEVGYGDAVVELSPDLSTVLGSDHPISPRLFGRYSVDMDVAGTPVLFTPPGVGCATEAAVQSKSGFLYLYDESRIGAGAIQTFRLAPATSSDEFLGSPAYSPATGLLYVATPSSANSLFPPGMLAIDPNCGHPGMVWNSTFGPDTANAGAPRSAVSVSAGGVVFVGTMCESSQNGSCVAPASMQSNARTNASPKMKRQICCYPPSQAGGAVWAVDASTGTVLNGGQPLLYTSGRIRAPVMLDGSWLYVLDINGDLYGLTIDNRYSPTQEKPRPLSPRIMTHWETDPAIH